MGSYSGPEIELDHIGVAVKDLESAYPFWKVLGWQPDPNPERVEGQKVKVGMLPLQNQANIELLEPLSDQSPVQKFMDKRGPGIHHICFRVKGINNLLSKLKAAGVRLINEQAVPGAHGSMVAFVHPASTGGILIELNEKAEK